MFTETQSAIESISGYTHIPDSPTKPINKGKAALNPLWHAGGFVIILVAWEVAANNLNSPYFSPVTKIAPALVRIILSGEALDHLLYSMQHILIGLAIAALFGFVFGLLIAESLIARALLLPVADTVRSVAALTLFPLLLLILGLGVWAKSFVIFWTAWPAILLSTYHALTHVEREIIEAAMLDGAGRMNILKNVSIPLSLPSILNGVRIGVGGGWISLVAAEMLGSSKGLGFYTLICSQTFHYPEMYAAILLIALTGFVMNTSLLFIQNITERKLYL
ncbi:MAG: ABC transporter permease subunit [Chloroflexi bacterium]|uniref:ABC transporter permease subunit n=1 Tax=Candidatus Chlorohelix allophototropha TaxID=3003348 RepID=A0A8T7M507_9CHLR|nr:ABC transporter permease subunit [Chloroflexota bacterium]WJW69089.1 ABC transporter permease subunit [Chloroflexota bacterium L227-S17]